MYEPKPVAYCILDVDMERCEHIEYGVEDAPLDSIKLYDQYVVERLQRRIEASEKANEYLRSQLSAAKQPEAAVQATEVLPEYNSNVVVKFKDKHIEHHIYTNTIEQDNLTIIKEVTNMFPKGSVNNVVILEKMRNEHYGL